MNRDGTRPRMPQVEYEYHFIEYEYHFIEYKDRQS